MNINNEIKFLEDKALENISSDKLGHKSISNTLFEIIRICPLPFTIGLFGNWGTGKSTIANFLIGKIRSIRKLRNGEPKIAVVQFDVWKYEKDSLRRQFLINLKDQLKDQEALKGFVFDERLFAKISVNFESRWRYNKDKSKQFFRIVLPCAIFIVALAWFFYSYFPPIFPIFISIVSSFFTLIGFTALSKSISQLVTTESKSLAYDKFTDPDEFEKMFEDIIEKSSAEKILIIVDNLDRATDKKAIEALSTIKTFLEPKSDKCIFLIQCDEVAIKKHLKTIYKYKEDCDTDEFLRKFFNTFIKIPPFIDVDLEAYVRGVLKETGLEKLYNDNDLVTVIVKGFRDNPRQIKQFVNMFIAHYMLAIKRESGKKPIINKGSISDYPASLGKLLVIRQKWFHEYMEIVNNPKLLTSGLNGEVYTYLQSTNSIQINDPRALIYFKKSFSQLALGGVEDELKIALEDYKVEDVTKILEEARLKKVKDEQIGRFIIELFGLNKDQSQNLINIINITGKMGVSVSEELGEKALEVVDQKLKDQLGILKIESILKFLRSSRKTYDHRKRVIDAYINYLSRGKETDYVGKQINYIDLSREIVEKVIGNIDIFSSYQKEISDALEKGHFDNFKILELFRGKTKTVKMLITKSLLTKSIDSIPVPSAANPEAFDKIVIGEMMNLILELDTDDGEQVGTAYLQKVTTSITEYLGAIHPDREKYFQEVLKYTKLGINRYSQKVQSVVLGSLSDSLRQALGTFAEYPKKIEIATLIIKLVDIVPDDKKQGLQQALQSLAQNADYESLTDLLDQIDERLRKTFLFHTKADLENRVLNDINLFNLIWKYETIDEKSDLINKIIASGNYKIALEKLENTGYRVKHKADISRRIFEKLSSMDIQLRPILYEALNGLKCGDDKNLKEDYINQLQSLVINQPRNVQEVAFDAYNEAISMRFVSLPLRLKFSVSVIEWLNTLGAIGLDNEFALRIAISDYSNLSITHKDNLLNNIFDKMIAKTGTIEEINLGFDLIYQVKSQVKYKKDNKQHFDVAHSRLQSEQNIEIKKALVTGFIKISPDRELKYSKSFWNEIKRMSDSLGI